MSDKTKESAENTDAEAPAAPKVDKRHRKIMAPMTDGKPAAGGEPTEVNRTDYIRQLWTEGQKTEDGATYMMTRAEIRAHVANDCTAENGENDIAYQIVFAATKGLDGGPSDEEAKARKEAVKAAKAAEKAEKASEEAADADEGSDDSDEDAGEAEGEDPDGDDDDDLPAYG